MPYLRVPFDECVDVFGAYGKEMMLADIRTDLECFGVRFDTWFSEGSLLQDGSVQQSLDELLESRNVYEQDGALWLRSTMFGDDKDRVVVKKDKSYTYLATDIAYHRNKLARGYRSWSISGVPTTTATSRGCKPLSRPSAIPRIRFMCCWCSWSLSCGTDSRSRCPSGQARS